MLRHIVLTKFIHPDTEAAEASRRLLALKDRIPEIVSMETHFDILHSDRSYDLILIADFRSMEDFLVYADHPEHVEVKKYIAAHRSGSVTMDYEI